MLDDIIELILDLVLNGAAEAVDCKKAPIWIRILSAIIILAVVIGFGGLLIWSGVNEGKLVLILLGIGVFVLFAMLGIYKVIKYRK